MSPVRLQLPFACAVVAIMCAVPAVGASAKAAARTSVSGTVWIDSDADGRREGGEPGARRVVVVIERRGRTGRYTRVGMLRTDARGRWRQPVRRAAVHRVRVLLPASSARFSPRNRGRDATDSDVVASGRSAGSASAGRVRPGGRSRRIDAGLVPKAASSPPGPQPAPPAPAPQITGLVWEDADADGVRDLAEAGRAGVTLELWDAARAASLASTTTSADGRWAFTVPDPAGSFRVRVVLPAGAFYAPGGTGSAVADAGADAGFSFPLLAGRTGVEVGLRSGSPITVGGFVWNDEDDDGLQGAGSSAMVAIPVELWNDSLTQRLAATLTDTGGQYALPAQANGVYRLRVAPPTGYMLGKPDAGANDELDSDVLRVGAGAGFSATLRPPASTTSVDAALLLGTPVGDRVWNDLDADGAQDPGEPGLAGVVVQLWNVAKSSLLGSDVTNAAGLYQLRAPPGPARVRVVLPPGGSFAPRDATDDAADSDVDGANGFTDPLTVGAAPITAIDGGVTF